MVHFIDGPDPSRDGDLVPDRRRLDDRSQLLGTGMDLVLDIFLKDRIEFVIICDALSRDPDDQAAVLSSVNVVDLQKMA